MQLLRDLAETSGYWAAVWTMCPLGDVHVVCDAPIGCFNLVGTAVPDYTDAIPHIENLTPSVITEKEVSGTGTAPAVERTILGLQAAGTLEGKRLIVMSTAESEMIGADHTDLVRRLEPDARFYYSNSLGEDEWTGRDRVLGWLWDEYGAPAAGDIAAQKGRVTIIGPTYGCFNSPSDLHEVQRLIRGAGGTPGLAYPYGATLADTARLAEGEIVVQLYQEFGQTLATKLGKPVVQAPFGMRATDAFVREIGRLLGTSQQAEAFIRRERKTTLQTLWDLWRGPQSDWYATTTVGIVAGRSYAEGLRDFLGGELGMPVQFAIGRPRRLDEADNSAIRAMLHERAPTMLFGSINEHIYLAESGGRGTHFIPAAFPGPIVRRAVGTPFMGYRGAVYVVQEIINALYDSLFNFLPIDNHAKPASPAAKPVVSSAPSLPWQADARVRLDQVLETMPFLPRISASRELQRAAETEADKYGLAEVTVEMVEAILPAARN
ncbi:MAG: chlorophyllide a reductase subunit Z [Herpetosiphonaceae bacterium]|nr:chlorophyllide a reductase subunit Z [Herpetosiphonaceae bacterium]